MSENSRTKRQLLGEIEELKNHLSEAEGTVKTIRSAAVGALVVSDERQKRIFTLESVNYSYRVMVENMSEGAVILKDDGIIIFSNKTFSSMLGRETEALIGTHLSKLLPEDMRSDFAEFLNECKIRACRKDFIITDDFAIPVSVSGTNFNAGGQANLCLIVDDLRERRNTEEQLLRQQEEIRTANEELRAQNEELRQTNEELNAANMESATARNRFFNLYEFAPVGYLTLDRTGIIREVNRETLGIFNHRKNAMLGRRLRDFVADGFGRQYDDFFEKIAAGKETAKLRFAKSKGEMDVQLIGVPVKHEPDDSIDYYISLTDITRGEKAEAEREQLLFDVQQEREKLRIMLGSIPEEVWFLDTEENTIFLNPNVIMGVGFESDESQSVNDIISNLEILNPDGKPRPREDAPLLRALRNGEIVEGDELLRHLKTGEMRYRHYRAAPVKAQNGRIFGAIAIIIDLTERKKAEESLKRHVEELKRANEELQRFAYVASHDLQEPLRMVSSYMQLLEKRYKNKLDQDADEFIGFAVGAAKRMQEMILGLLEYSRINTRGNPMKPVSMEEVLREVLENMRPEIEGNNARITHDKLPTVLGDGPQLARALCNLISNSIKFRGRETPRIHIGARFKDGQWLLSVKDNGIGIDPMYHERVFIIFQKLHGFEYEGSGIGLAIAKRIIERHGGRMYLESEPGKGATFYLTLPPPYKDLQTEAQSAETKRGHRILS